MPERFPPITRVPGLISIILGTYNIEKYIAQTLDTLTSQTYANFEIVVIDDGSTDGTREVLARYGDQIRVIAQPNGGVAASRNTGLRHARGEFIAFMDHDDLCPPDRLTITKAVLDAYPDVGLVSTEFRGFNENGILDTHYAKHYYDQCNPDKGMPKCHYPQHTTFDIGPFEHPARTEPHVVPLYVGNVLEPMVGGNFVHPPTMLMRGALLDQMEGFDGSAKTMCDWEWLLRLSKITQFAYLDHPLSDYRRSSFQISSPRHEKQAHKDILYVSERAAAHNPELFARNRKVYTEHLAMATLAVAYDHTDSDRPLAWQHLWKALRQYGGYNRFALTIFAKLALPSALVRAVSKPRQPAA